MGNKFHLREILKFGVGGGTAVIVDFLFYYILMNIGIERLISKTISFILGATVGFIINKLWTFESKQYNNVEIIKYIMLYLFSSTINGLINQCILEISLNELIAFFCATAVSTIINFIGQKFFVFKKEKENKYGL